MIAIEHEQMGYLTCKLTKTNAVADGSIQPQITSLSPGPHSTRHAQIESLLGLSVACEKMRVGVFGFIP